MLVCIYTKEFHHNSFSHHLCLTFQSLPVCSQNQRWMNIPQKPRRSSSKSSNHRQVPPLMDWASGHCSEKLNNLSGHPASTVRPSEFRRIQWCYDKSGRRLNVPETQTLQSNSEVEAVKVLNWRNDRLSYKCSCNCIFTMLFSTEAGTWMSSDFLCFSYTWRCLIFF